MESLKRNIREELVKMEVSFFREETLKRVMLELKTVNSIYSYFFSYFYFIFYLFSILNLGLKVIMTLQTIISYDTMSYRRI